MHYKDQLDQVDEEMWQDEHKATPLAFSRSTVIDDEDELMELIQEQEES